MAKGTQHLPPDQSSAWRDAKYLGNGYLVSPSVERRGLAFLHIPPVASRKPAEGWSIPPLSFEISGYAVYPPENVLAVAEKEQG
jgi:hypothetical protein